MERFRGWGIPGKREDSLGEGFVDEEGENSDEKGRFQKNREHLSGSGGWLSV